MFDGTQPAGRTSLSTDLDDQSEVSEEGYIMDMSLVAKLIDNFNVPARKMKNFAKEGQLKDFYAPIRLDQMSTEKYRKLPTFLDLANLGKFCFMLLDVAPSLNFLSSASLLMLAVISRPGLSLSVSDLVRMFNSEALYRLNASVFIPPSYKLSGDEKSRFRFIYSGRSFD